MPHAFRFRRWWIVAFFGLLILVTWSSMLSNSNEPVYQGRKLGSWLRGHPREYYPAVLATGTNALPYLLAEIQATDSSLSEWGQGMLGKASIGPPWRTARERRYHARLGLQILDTNSSAVLLQQIFATPMRIAENDPGCAAASSLSFMSSAAAQVQIVTRIEQAFQSPDSVERRNACLTVWFWPRTNFAQSLPKLTEDTNATVRVAAVIAMLFSKWDTNFLPALVARLDDNEAAVRRFAAEALGHQTTNALSALPALLAAHAAETSRPNARSDLGLGYLNESAYSTQGVRAVMESSIRSIGTNGRFGRAMPGPR